MNLSLLNDDFTRADVAITGDAVVVSGRLWSRCIQALCVNQCDVGVLSICCRPI